MLGLYKFNRALARSAYKGIFLVVFLISSQLSAVQFEEREILLPDEYKWVKRYFDSLSDNVSIPEMVDFLVSLRLGLEAKGYSVPSLEELSLKMKYYLIESGIQINEEDFQVIYDEIKSREGFFYQDLIRFSLNDLSNAEIVLIKNKKEKAKLEMSDEFAIGFVKALGGALLCIIPHPVTWAIGSVLVADGIVDMVAHAEDTSLGKNVEDRLRNLPPPPQYLKP